MNNIESKNNLKKFSNIDACPIRNIIASFSGKWSILVLCLIAENPSIRFNTISKSIPDISAKVLTDTLKSLERDGFVSKKIYAEIPPKVEYSLTDLGESLMPHIDGLIKWAIEHFQEVTGNRRG